MTTVHCTIETDPDTGGYIGWLINFRHFAVVGATPDEVENLLRSKVLNMHASGTLTIECELVRVVSIDLPAEPSER